MRRGSNFASIGSFVLVVTRGLVKSFTTNKEFFFSLNLARGGNPAPPPAARARLQRCRKDQGLASQERKARKGDGAFDVGLRKGQVKEIGGMHKS